MNSLSRIIFLFLFLFSVNSFAETLCVNNAKDYAQYKASLPVLFRELPVKLGGEGSILFIKIFAVIKISIIENTIVLNSDSWQGPKGHYKDMNEVKRVCFDMDSKEVIISFITKDKGRTKDFQAFFTDTQIRTPDLTLKKITNNQEDELIKKIYSKVSRKPSPKVESEKQGGNN